MKIRWTNFFLNNLVDEFEILRKFEKKQLFEFGNNNQWIANVIWKELK